jgi:hypothetical protein
MLPEDSKSGVDSKTSNNSAAAVKKGEDASNDGDFSFLLFFSVAFKKLVCFLPNIPRSPN